MFASAKGKQQKNVSQLHCQEQCIDNIPNNLAGLLRAHFFRNNCKQRCLAAVKPHETKYSQ